MDVQFSNNSTSENSTNLSYLWNFGLGKNEGTSPEENPMHTYNDSSIYHVQLIATDSYNCKDTLVETLIVIPLIKVWLPDVFTPNNDGHNDLLIIRGPMSKLHFEIYNQWGFSVFSTDDQSVGWDGKYKGVEQPEGNYIWRITGTTLDGRDVHEHGVTMLIR